MTIPIHIQYLKGSYLPVDMGATMAMIMLSIIPIIVFYLSCQKHIIKGRRRRCGQGLIHYIFLHIPKKQVIYMNRSSGVLMAMSSAVQLRHRHDGQMRL